MIDHAKISFLTTVSNFKLYKKTSLFYPDNIDRYVIDGTTGMFAMNSIIYMMEMLQHKDIDWLIMIDEDAIMIDFENIMDLINHMNEYDFLACGMQDGGVNPIRKQSPIAINTYFSVINFKVLKSIWNKEEVLKNQYIDKCEFVLSKDFLKYEFDENSLFEDYYCFYFWMLRKGYKILYLNAENSIENDGYSNMLFNHEGKPLLYHTWYARLYGTSKNHTERINKVIQIREKIDNKKSTYIKPVIFINRSFKTKNKVTLFEKYIKKIKNVIKKNLLVLKVITRVTIIMCTRDIAHFIGETF